MDSKRQVWWINNFLTELGGSLMFYMSEVIDFQYQVSFFSEEYIKLFGMEEIKVHNDKRSSSSLTTPFDGYWIEFYCRNGIVNELLQRESVWAWTSWVTPEDNRALNGWGYKKFDSFSLRPEDYSKEGKGSLDEVSARSGALSAVHELLRSTLVRETAPARSTMRELTEHEQRTREGVFKLYRYMFGDSCDVELIEQAFEVAKLEKNMQRLYDAVPG